MVTEVSKPYYEARIHLWAVMSTHLETDFPFSTVHTRLYNSRMAAWRGYLWFRLLVLAYKIGL